jgi:hypothetical protein
MAGFSFVLYNIKQPGLAGHAGSSSAHTHDSKPTFAIFGFGHAFTKEARMSCGLKSRN